jgi:osmotically-inducible protein OsmY
MARDDRWREERRWDFDREAREMQSRPDYGQTDNGQGYGYRDYRRAPYGEGYRGDDRYRGEDRYRREPEAAYDERAYRGSGGPTPDYVDPAYGYGAPGAYSPWSGYPARGYAPRGEFRPREDRYTPNPREGRGQEPRSFLDKATDEVASWFGDEDAVRRRRWDEQRASHRGRGPKDYRRSDERIREDINDRLTEDHWLDATDVQVGVEGGEVTLSGHVRSREDKRRAERLAEQVPGVGDVQNNIRLKREDVSGHAEAPSAGNF